MILGQLMVVEIVERRIVRMPDIDDRDGGIGQVGGDGFASHDGHRSNGEEHAAREELVFVRAAGVRENRGKRRHETADAA